MRRPWGLRQDLASDSAMASPPRYLQVLSCTRDRKLYPSWNTDQRTRGIKAGHLMACLQRLHCFLLTPCNRAQRCVGILRKTYFPRNKHSPQQIPTTHYNASPCLCCWLTPSLQTHFRMRGSSVSENVNISLGGTSCSAQGGICGRVDAVL